MLRSKYLEELGVNTNICEWVDKNHPDYQEFIKYEKEYGVFPPANWNFDHYFARWLYCYLKDYVKVAGEIVDLNYYKLNFEGQEYTQLTAIEKIINTLESFIINIDAVNINEEEINLYNEYKNAIHLFAEILSTLWW